MEKEPLTSGAFPVHAMGRLPLHGCEPSEIQPRVCRIPGQGLEARQVEPTGTRWPSRYFEQPSSRCSPP